MFNVGTLKSKTTVGLIAMSVWGTLHTVGVFPQEIFEFGAWVIGAFTGIAARDTAQKVLSKE
jgi:hypothetical protein